MITYLILNGSKLPADEAVTIFKANKGATLSNLGHHPLAWYEQGAIVTNSLTTEMTNLLNKGA